MGNEHPGAWLGRRLVGDTPQLLVVVRLIESRMIHYQLRYVVYIFSVFRLLQRLFAPGVLVFHYVADTGTDIFGDRGVEARAQIAIDRL